MIHRRSLKQCCESELISDQEGAFANRPRILNDWKVSTKHSTKTIKEPYYIEHKKQFGGQNVWLNYKIGEETEKGKSNTVVYCS